MMTKCIGPGGFVGEVSWLIKLFYTKFLAHAALGNPDFTRARAIAKRPCPRILERESKMKMMGYELTRVIQRENENDGI